MRPIANQILTWLVIAFFISGLYAQYTDLPWPAKCESDKDCLKGKASCIRRECHCKDAYAYGDGKTKCEQGTKCSSQWDSVLCKKSKSKNSHCLKTTDGAACKCNDGYFGRPEYGCMKVPDKGEDRYPCISDDNCPAYAECLGRLRRKRCTCRDELVGNGETCSLPKKKLFCLLRADCGPLGDCVDNRCQCVGSYVGDGGEYCREGKPCPSNIKCGSNAICLVDPHFPNAHLCKCNDGFRKNKHKNCVECLHNGHCTKKYSICVNEKCECRGELTLGKESCEPAPLHECKTDQDCDERAKCDEGNCICQGKTTGNGKYCRASLDCPKDYQCGVGGTCVVDPYMPETIHCRCDKGYVKATDGKCVECLSDNDCNANYSTCESQICKCKGELVKGPRMTCKRAPAHPCSKNEDCHKNAECHRGKCHCIGESTGNGKICRASLTCPKELHCDDTSVCVVDPLFPNKPECRCHLHFKKSTGKTENKTICEEMTECEKKGLVCSAEEVCRKINRQLGFICACEKGSEMVYTGGKRSCQDVDECMKANACPANSVCKNTKGSYECQCNSGYKKNANGGCEDVCNCGADASCHKGTCVCNKGFTTNKHGKCVAAYLEGGGQNLLQGSGHSLYVSGHRSTLITLILGLLWRLAFTA